MIFQDCFSGLEIDRDRMEIIDACLQALTQKVEWLLGVLDDLSEGESSGTDVASIYIDSDMQGNDGSCPAFEGVCFNYLQEYAVVSKSEAHQILIACLKVLHVEYVWSGFIN